MGFNFVDEKETSEAEKTSRKASMSNKSKENIANLEKSDESNSYVSLCRTFFKLNEEYLRHFGEFKSEDTDDKYQIYPTDERFIQTVVFNPAFSRKQLNRSICSQINLKGDEDTMKKFDDGNGGGWLNSKEWNEFLDERDKAFKEREKYEKKFKISLFNISEVNHRLDLFYGSGGTGKTTMATFLAKYVFKDEHPFICPCNSKTTFASLVKSFTFDQNGNPVYESGGMLEKMIKGGIVVFDEFNMIDPDSMVTLQSVFDNKGVVNLGKINPQLNGEIKIHPNFRVIGCFNNDVKTGVRGSDIIPTVLVERCYQVIDFDKLSGKNANEIKSHHFINKNFGVYYKDLQKIENDFEDHKITEKEYNEKVTFLRKNYRSKDGGVNMDKILAKDFLTLEAFEPYRNQMSKEEIERITNLFKETPTVTHKKEDLPVK